MNIGDIVFYVRLMDIDEVQNLLELLRDRLNIQAGTMESLSGRITLETECRQEATIRQDIHFAAIESRLRYLEASQKEATEREERHVRMLAQFICEGGETIDRVTTLEQLVGLLEDDTAHLASKQARFDRNQAALEGNIEEVREAVERVAADLRHHLDVYEEALADSDADRASQLGMHNEQIGGLCKLLARLYARVGSVDDQVDALASAITELEQKPCSVGELVYTIKMEIEPFDADAMTEEFLNDLVDRVARKIAQVRASRQ